MRGKRLKMNTTAAMAQQIVSLLCGFVLPRFILDAYGSEVNGLVNSIAQFLNIIGFLELGMGAVVMSALYKPLAEKDDSLLSKILASSQKFFRRIAWILLAYIFILMMGYPYVANQDFGWVYTAVLIVALSVSSFAQYYFGIVDSLLLTSDQRGYIIYTSQIVTLVLNTAMSIALIKMGAGIHAMKLCASALYLLRPLALRCYVSKHYNIDRKIKYEGEPIKQKWNGIAQHVATYVLESTDSVVLTVFSTLDNVSVYSVYHLVVYGIKYVFSTLTSGIHALIGELWAKQETKTLNWTYSWFEWLLHVGVTFAYGCTAVLIVPFVMAYTNGVVDVDYAQPLFGVVLTLAQAFHCLLMPCNVIIQAAGHYKETQKCFVISASLNLLISIPGVIAFGLVGVAFGTLASMVYQTLWMEFYVAKNLIPGSLKRFRNLLLTDILTVVVGLLATSWLKFTEVSFVSWVLMAIPVAAIWLVIAVVVNFIFYRDKMLALCRKLPLIKKMVR